MTPSSYGRSAANAKVTAQSKLRSKLFTMRSVERAFLARYMHSLGRNEQQNLMLPRRLFCEKTKNK